MLKLAATFTVPWAHCDAAGIVYYPRYYEIFDTHTHAMLSAVGLDHRTLHTRYGIVGLSLVEAKATFRGPATFDDTLTVVSEVEHIGRSSLRIAHRILRGEAPIVDGHEVRVWALKKGDGQLTTSPIPDEVRALLSQAMQG